MKKKTKDVLILCQFFYPEYISSATLPFDTAKYLSEKGYKVGALCGYPKEYWNGTQVPKKETVDGIEINRISYAQPDRKSVIGRVVNYFSFVFSLLFHMNVAKTYKTIMFYSNPPLLPFIALLCKTLYGCKIVYVSYDVYPELAIKANMLKKGGMGARFFDALNKKVVKKTDKIVALSTDMEQFFVENRGASKEKVCTIPNWYEDCAKKTFEKTAIVNDIPKDAFLISYLGNLGTCQDADILVETAKLLENEKVYLLVAGHGNKLEALKNKVDSEKLKNIKVLPFLHGSDYDTVLQRSDMFFTTLIPGLKGLCAPSKTYAYLMSGKPVIVSMDEEMEIAKDVVDYQAGILVKNGDYEYVAKEIVRVKSNDTVSEIMGKNARKLYEEKYEKSICLEKYEQLIQEMIGK